MRIIFYLLIVSILTAACSRSDEPLNLQAPHNKYILCRGTPLYLNDGKKWPSNKETTTGIDSMIAQVNAFQVPADTVAFHALGDALMDDYIYIINYCVDMGPAHEMIHSYLFPIQEIIIPLQISGEVTCSAQYTKLKDYLARYHEYFE